MDNTKSSNERRESQLVEDTELELKSMSSVALARVAAEVQNNGDGGLTSSTTYNRTYHRHNR